MATYTPRAGGIQATFYIPSSNRRVRKQFPDRATAESIVSQIIALDHQGKPFDHLLSARGSLGDTTRTLANLQLIALQTHWKGSKGEETAATNSKDAVDILGGDFQVARITAEHIDQLVVAWELRGLSNATINRKFAALSVMLNIAMERGWIDKRPRLKRRKEAEGRIRWLTVDEEEAMDKWLRHFGKPEVARLVTFLIDTGARPSEAFKLRYTDIGADRVHLWDTKNGGSRTVPLSTRLRAMGLRSGADWGPFCGMTKDSLEWAWNRVRHQMGLSLDVQFVPYACRHTCASRLVQAGVELLVVKEWMGHKAIQQTLTYAHLAPKNLFTALDKLEGSQAPATDTSGNIDTRPSL